MTKPRYARFFKCDLQMQTPGDRRYWVGSEGRLGDDPTDEDVAATAEAYVRQVHEVGLDVIAVTDHNLGGELGMRFLTAVQKQARRLQLERELTVFPGFEVCANVGGRVHLLCLFEPGTDVAVVRDALLDLDLRDHDWGQADSSKNLAEVLTTIQDKRHGIVIAAHVTRSYGAIDRSVHENWQVDTVKNDDLLCIELPKPRGFYRSGKLGDIVANRGEQWGQRKHPIAVVNSSDCKRLRADDGNGDESWIGKRHTWIKMSEPSIEGLRQAFLDHESRIRFGDDCPEDGEIHPRIERIEISGTRFLADQTILLSPNLNTFIGGGGTGKSTILEFVRAALGQRPTSSEDVLDNHDRALRTLGTSGCVELTVRLGDEEFSVKLDSGGSASSAIASRFPITAFGQREIFAVASSQPATLQLLDDLQRDSMAELDRRARTADVALANLDEERSRLPALRRDAEQLAEQIARLRADLSAVEARQAPLAALNQQRRQADAVAAIDAAVDRVADQIEQSAEQLTVSVGNSTFRSPDTPDAEAVEALLDRTRRAVDDAADAVRQVALTLRSKAAEERSRLERAEWNRALEDALAQYQRLVDQSGDPRDAEGLRVEISLREAELSAVKQEITALEARDLERPVAVGSLHAIWTEQVAARQEIAKSLKDVVPVTEGEGRPYVEATIVPYGDTRPLRQRINQLVHGSALTEEEAGQLCRAAQDASLGERNPASIVANWIRALGEGEMPDGLPDLRQAARNGLVRDISDVERDRLDRLRVPDQAKVLLRRRDGTDAGYLDGGLSVGQRCTAILALVLAAGHDPVLIDQPEDEIDNEFIYRELVPLLRQAKQHRQVIVATHNPNIPVNGDAELIYPLRARVIDGDVRGATFEDPPGRDAVGSLDREPVKTAVEEIMEGSQEAFERRRVRYGF